MERAELPPLTKAGLQPDPGDELMPLLDGYLTFRFATPNESAGGVGRPQLALR